MTQSKYHLIGIGGIGMSSLARILAQKKYTVSGSDLAASYVTDGLIKEGIQVTFGQKGENVPEGATVVYSTDIKKDNPEFQGAVSKGNPLLHRSDMLAQLLSEKKALAVAGTHGKTTTTGLLVSALIEAGIDPSYAVGGILPQFQSNGGHGEGAYFVAEADESDGTFLRYHPDGAILTNIDNDHIDHYQNVANLGDAFKQFTQQVVDPSKIVWCYDDPHLKKMDLPGVSYGFSERSLARLINFKQQGWGITYDLKWKDVLYKQIEVPLVGRHNALNSAAVFILALLVGGNEKGIRKGLREFGGVLRRCEKKGEAQGILFLDDYAHHPTEIATTLKGIKQAVQERRLIALFQPHRYTRTRDCLGQFAGIFDAADHVFVTEIYGARETPIAGVDGQRVADEIGPRGRFVAKDHLKDLLKEFLQPHDVVVTLGAGDITKFNVELIKELKANPLPKIRVGVVFGGQSLEHEVSLRSAKHVIGSLNPEIYAISRFGIAKSGKWVYNPPEDGLTIPEPYQKEQISIEVLEEMNRCDLFFPVLHGPYGEDGTIQGFFEMLGKGYVGCNHQAAAVSMDKALVKKLMVLSGIATSPFCDFSARDWNSFSQIILEQIERQLTYPLFVKPVHLGSSVGISRVESERDLLRAIKEALEFDTHVLVENGVDGREIEFAVQGNLDPLAYPPGEILTGGGFYDYAAKYGIQSTPTTPQAELPEALAEEGMQIAELAYKAAGCNGMARIDFFLDSQGKYWLSEINPIPGFTSISLYPQICAINGLPGRALMDRLIVLALHQRREKERLNSPLNQPVTESVPV